MKGKKLITATLLLALGGASGYYYYFAKRHSDKIPAPYKEYHLKMKLDEAITQVDTKYVNALASHIKETQEKSPGNSLELTYLRAKHGNAPYVAAAMSLEGINTKDIGQVREALGTFAYSQGIELGNPNPDFLLGIMTAKALVSTPAGIAVFIGGNIIHQSETRRKKEQRMEHLADEIPAIRPYRAQHGEWPSDYEIEKMRRLGNAYAVPEPASTWPDPDRSVIKRERLYSEGGEAVREYRSDGTPQQIEQQRQQATWDDANRRFREDSAGRAATGVAGAAKQGVDVIGKAAGDFLQGLSKPPEKKKQ